MIKQQSLGAKRPVRIRQARRSVFLLAGLVATMGLTACGSDQQATQMPRIIGEFAKSVGTAAAARLGSGKKDAGAAQSAPKADPNAMVKTALAATPGPIAVVLRENTKAVSLLTPVQSNAGAQTWMSADKRALIVKGGVIVGTRGLGDDLMASDAATARSAIRARRASSYQRSYDHLTGLGETSKLRVDCRLAPGKSERISIGEINASATVMKENCSHPIGIQFENLYWVTGNGRIVKSRQWISQSVRSLVVQPLR